jgi:hypothetical protein
MSNDGSNATPRQSTPRRITLQGRTFGKLEHAVTIHEITGEHEAIPENTDESRVSGPQRTTGARPRASRRSSERMLEAQIEK